MLALVLAGVATVATGRLTGNRGCALHARATVVTRDTPIARATGWNTDVLAVRNLDGADWDDLDITIYGFVTGTSGRQVTGPYKVKKGAGSSSGGLMAFNLNDFENASGARWVSLTMTVDDIDLKASLGGKSCAAEISPSASVMDVIGR